MKIEFLEHCIKIIPENDVERVYLKTVLCLRSCGDEATVTFIPFVGFDYNLSYLKLVPHYFKEIERK